VFLLRRKEFQRIFKVNFELERCSISLTHSCGIRVVPRLFKFLEPSFAHLIRAWQELADYSMRDTTIATRLWNPLSVPNNRRQERCAFMSQSGSASIVGLGYGAEELRCEASWLLSGRASAITQLRR
jgi:hypothetical protein